MTALGLLKHWKLIATAIYVLAMGAMLAISQANTRHWKKVAEGEKQAHALTIAEVEKKTAEAKAADEAHARQIEQTQVKVSQEVSSEYQARLAALRARYDSLRAGEAPTPSSGGRGEGLPSIPDPSGGPDAAAADYAFRCEADAIQLMSLQDWIREQLSIPR